MIFLWAQMVFMEAMNDTAECTDPRLEMNCTDPGSVQNCSDICTQNNETFPPECQDELLDICVRTKYWNLRSMHVYA